jgi:hypothetical protein
MSAASIDQADTAASHRQAEAILNFASREVDARVRPSLAARLKIIPARASAAAAVSAHG